MENLDLIPLQEGDNPIYTQEQVDKDKRVGTYDGRFLPKGGIYSSMKDEIEDKFYSKLPTMNKEETLELKEHILSDEELRIFLDESL